MSPFFNPTIEVVTFRFRRWCMLGLFLLLAFTRQGHERQDLLSLCDEMRVCTDYRPRLILSSERVCLLFVCLFVFVLGFFFCLFVFLFFFGGGGGGREGGTRQGAEGGD